MRKALLLMAGLALAFTLAAPKTADACICTKQYAPVCAISGNVAKTYGNACMAGCAKAKICAKGACQPCPVYRLAKPRPGCTYIWTWQGCCRKPRLVCKSGCFCTKIYKPVCARKGSSIKTYGNACEARCARASVCAQGPCRCPMFKLAQPRPGCKYVWYTKGCCKYPKLVCNLKPYCTKERCSVCNKGCQAQQQRCYTTAKNLSYASVRAIRARCARAVPNTSLWRCLCSWAKRRAPENVILQGMRGCYLSQCRSYKCCRTGAKLCYPHPPNVRCVRAPCCRKLVCAPGRCR